VQKNLSSIKDTGLESGAQLIFLIGVDHGSLWCRVDGALISFLGYWRKCEEIFPLFVSFSFQSHESILHYVFFQEQIAE